MKTVFISLIFIVAILGTNNKVDAQIAIYDTCNNLRQLDGEWKYVNGTETLKVYFRTKVFHSLSYNNFNASLIGWHELTNGSTIIQSDYSHRFDSLPTDFLSRKNLIYSINLGYSDCNNPIDTLTGVMIDQNKNNRLQYWMVSRISPTTIKVKQTAGEGLSTVTYIPGFTLPQTFVLVKQ